MGPVDATQGPDQCRRQTHSTPGTPAEAAQDQCATRRQQTRRPTQHQATQSPRAAVRTHQERRLTMPDGLLSQEHEAALAAAKRKLREENEEYIRQHPELRGAIRLLMAKLLDD